MPEFFIDDYSNLAERFEICSKENGIPIETVKQLLRLLPERLRVAPVWLDRITKIWKYEYGLPIKLPEDMILVGSNQFPVNELFKAMSIAIERLSDSQLLTYIKRLESPEKHSDVLFEMRPLAEVEKEVIAEFEVEGFGPGNTTLDWKVTGEGIIIIFDVKNRIKSFIIHMEEITPSMNRGEDRFEPNPPDPADLFKNTEKKFLPADFHNKIQGVWIHTQIKEDYGKLREYFEKSLDKDKLHFAVFSDWQKDATILARDSSIIEKLTRIFKIELSDRFTADDYTYEK